MPWQDGQGASVQYIIGLNPNIKGFEICKFFTRANREEDNRKQTTINFHFEIFTMVMEVLSLNPARQNYFWLVIIWTLKFVHCLVMSLIVEEHSSAAHNKLF